MKISSILQILCISQVAAQTVTSTSSTVAKQSTPALTAAASTNTITTTTLSIWLNTTSSDLPTSVYPGSVVCGTTNLFLEYPYSASSDSQRIDAFYEFGSSFFVSGYEAPHYGTTQSCALVGSSSSSYFSCQGIYITFLSSGVLSVQASTTTTTFTLPTSSLVLKGFPIGMSLEYINGTCTSAAASAVDVRTAVVFATLFCTVLLGVLS